MNEIYFCSNLKYNECLLMFRNEIKCVEKTKMQKAFGNKYFVKLAHFLLMSEYRSIASISCSKINDTPV